MILPFGNGFAMWRLLFWRGFHTQSPNHSHPTSHGNDNSNACQTPHDCYLGREDRSFFSNLLSASRPWLPWRSHSFGTGTSPGCPFWSRVPLGKLLCPFCVYGLLLWDANAIRQILRASTSRTAIWFISNTRELKWIWMTRFRPCDTYTTPRLWS